jgi:cytochrome c-type biogenesis protein CcmH
VVAGALVLALVALVVVAARGPGHPPTVTERINAIAANLRCPVCQNLSVADSPSELARDMRAEIGRRLQAGQTKEQIDAYFVAKFGRWILLTPDTGGIGLFAWLTPVLAAVVGGLVAWAVVLRRRRSPALASGPAEADSVVGPDDGDQAGSAAEPRLTEAERAEIQREVDALEEDG